MPGVSQSQSDQVEVMLGQLRFRMLLRLMERFRFVAPVVQTIFGATSLTIVLLDGALWRIAVVACAFAVMGAGMAIKRRFFARVGQYGCHRQPQTGFGVAPIIIVQSLVVLATGGLMSPLVVVTLVPSFAAGLLGDRRFSRMVMLLELSVFGLFLALHLSGLELVPAPFRAGEGHPKAWFVAVAVILVTAHTLSHVVGHRIFEGYEAQLRQLAHAREHALTTFEDRRRELTTLSGEIAHELKNPLASVKGLAALIGKELEGKQAERNTVMRREIDRMQHILDEFLNFSRPLAPLSLRRVPLRELAVKVMELHEGLATFAGVEVVVVADGDTEVTCDPRKVEQILINLLQNAIEASHSGERVVLRVLDDGPRVRIDVEDEGVGVDTEVGERVFEAGVTTKDHGSGLGLTVARAIAQQHRGELSLLGRVGGGSRARLVLPRTPDLTRAPDVAMDFEA